MLQDRHQTFQNWWRNGSEKLLPFLMDFRVVIAIFFEITLFLTHPVDIIISIIILEV